MTNQIKNFIEEGEKEFDKQFGGEGVIARTDENSILIGFTKKEVKEFWNSRQISLIKMIVEDLEKKMDEYEYHKDEIHCSCLGALREYIKDTISSKLKELIKE